jgi:hypothetical protein
MANRLRTSSGRISFFAFQDMITTVTGVLLLITLLLTFYLNEPQSPVPDETARNVVSDEVKAARAKLAPLLAELRRQQLQALALTNRVFVIPEPDRTGKQPVLVVLSATNGWCNRLGQSNAVEFVQRDDNADFRRLLDSWDPQSQRLVFYIRPSGIAHFAACRQLAAERAFKFGYDAAEEDKQYILATP